MRWEFGVILFFAAFGFGTELTGTWSSNGGHEMLRSMVKISCLNVIVSKSGLAGYGQSIYTSKRCNYDSFEKSHHSRTLADVRGGWNHFVTSSERLRRRLHRTALTKPTFARAAFSEPGPGRSCLPSSLSWEFLTKMAHGPRISNSWTQPALTNRWGSYAT